MKRFNCDFSSRFRILKGGKISLVVSALLGSVSLSFAAPSGGVVTSGGATISQSGNTTNIVQSTSKATINWQNFSIASNEIVNFNQPSVNSITLNRVIGNERSVIDGALNANGQVWILNSNGILFNSNAKINTAGLIATTKNITDADFNAGNYKFTGNSSESVVNMGEITIANNGYVALLADTVSNDGTIKALQGTIVFANGEATINLNGNSIVGIIVDKGVVDSLIENKGAVIADGGKIIMTSKAADEILKNVVNNSGIIEAKSFDDMFGSVEIVAQGGYIEHSGTIDVSSTTGKGGTATVTGYHTMITGTGVINADGKTGGGTIK
jgi:filamentous hemagglutinin family protein